MPVGGLYSNASLPYETGTMVPYSFPLAPSGLAVVMYEAISLTPSNGDGSLDLGIGVDLIANGDVHYRVSFQAVATGVPTGISLTFGPPPTRDAVVGFGGSIPFDNATYDLIVNPEPGPALLISLGLMGLAARRMPTA